MTTEREYTDEEYAEAAQEDDDPSLRYWATYPLEESTAHDTPDWDTFTPPQPNRSRRSAITPEDFTAWREQQDWTQELTARMFGVKPATISRWESGERAIPLMAVKLMQFLEEE